MIGIVETVAARAACHPDRPAIGGVTFAGLLERAERYAGGLRRVGLKPGDRVLLAAPPSADFYALALAVAGSGMSIVLVDGTLDRRRLLSALRSAGLQGVVGSADLLRRWWLVPPLYRTRRCALEELVGPRAPLTGTDPEIPAMISYTSGTTGRPKAVVRTHATLFGQHRALAHALPAEPGDVDMTCFPAIVLHNLCLGVPSVLPPIDFRRPAEADAEAVLDAAERDGVTTLSGAPAYLERVVGHLLATGRRLPRVRRVVVGGAPAPRSLCAAVLEAFPDADARIVYGATEAEPIAHVAMAEALADGPGVLVGTPVPEVEVVLADDGEVVVRGAGVAVAPGTWHRTGDIARRDERGRLWLLGRRGDAFEWGGRTIHPLPLEAAVRDLEGVRGAGLVAGVLAVAGDDRGFERARAHVRDLGLPVHRVDAIPVDARHHSKVDRRALAKVVARGG